MTTRVRTAILSDLPILLEFEKGIIQVERPMDRDLRPGDIHYYDLEGLIQDPNVEVCVVEVNGKLVGSGYAAIQQAQSYYSYNSYTYLGFMYTLPEYRGKGINQLIIDALAKWTREKGIRNMRLEVYHDNPNAIRAYEKAGFEPRLLEMRMELNG